MSNIGQQLQEERSRQGYSVKEVADIIHVRAEYIGQIEENTFEIPLHTVYIRGFVRLYAKFLKLDPDEMVDGFNKRNAQMEFSTEVTEERESLGTYVLPEDETRRVDAEKSSTNPFGRYREEDGENRPPWLFPAIMAGIVIIAFTVFFIVKISFFSDKQEIEAPAKTEQTPSSPTDAQGGFSVSELDENLIGLVAKDPVYIYVTQTVDNEILYSGRLEANERKTIIREGEISIACDKAENLIVEKGGIPIDLGATTGKVRFMVD